MTVEQLASPEWETACTLERRFVLPGGEANSVSIAAPAPAAPVVGERHRLVRNFGALVGAQLVTWTMTLLWTLVGPRLIGPGQFGIINTALSVGGVLLIFAGLASSVYLVREIVSRPADTEKLVGTAIVLKLALAPLMVIGAVTFVIFAHYGHEQTVAVYMAAIGSIAALVIDVQTGAFQSLERMHYIAYGGIIQKTGQSLIGIALALAGLGATGIVANTTVLALVVVVLQFTWLRRYMRIDFRTNVRRIKSMAKQSTPFWATGVFFTFYLWIDTILLSLMTSSKVVGWYAASSTLATTMMFLPQALAQTWLPRLVAAFNQSERELFRAARTPLTLVLLTGVPIAAGMAMAAHQIVFVLYGSAYAPAVAVMVVLAFFVPPTYVNIMTNQVLIASGRQMIATWTMVGAAVANPLLNLVLIPFTEHHYHNGAIGAAIALMLTEVLIALVGIVIVGRHVYDRTALRRCLLVTVASGSMWAVAWVARPLGAPIALTAGVITLIVLIVALRILTSDEIMFIKRILARLTARLTR